MKIIQLSLTPSRQQNSHRNQSLSSAQINHAAVKHQNKCKATDIVKVQDRSGMSHLLRVFIDQGSEGAFISERAAQLLGLPRKKENFPLTGLDDNSLGAAKSSMQIRVQSLINEFKMTIDAYVMQSIILSSTIDPELRKQWRHLDGLQLADPDFTNPSQIDLLFGVDIASVIILDGLKKGKPFEPSAQNSALGWLFFGATTTERK